jgi:hypothetical protein
MNTPAPTTTVGHRPLRPSWRCGTCGREWPCEHGKAELLQQYEHDRVGLLVYLAGLLVDAVQEIGGSPPEALMERFVQWAKAGEAD